MAAATLGICGVAPSGPGREPKFRGARSGIARDAARGLRRPAVPDAAGRVRHGQDHRLSAPYPPALGTARAGRRCPGAHLPGSPAPRAGRAGRSRPAYDSGGGCLARLGSGRHSAADARRNSRAGARARSGDPLRRAGRGAQPPRRGAWATVHRRALAHPAPTGVAGPRSARSLRPGGHELPNPHLPVARRTVGVSSQGWARAGG